MAIAMYFLFLESNVIVSFIVIRTELSQIANAEVYSYIIFLFERKVSLLRTP